MMNLVAGLALATWLVPGWQIMRSAYVALMAVVAISLAILQIVRNLRRQAAESEFAAWYRVPEGKALLLEQGYWKTVPIETGPIELGEIENSTPRGSHADENPALL